MIKAKQWPRPQDTAVDRARAICREYRQALQRVAPDVVARLDAAADALGESWLAETPQYHDDTEPLTTRQLAEALGEKTGTVDQWFRRGIITRHPGGYFLPEVTRELQVWRAKRVQRGQGEQEAS